MRKLFIMFVAIATIGLIGCNQPNPEPATNADSTLADTASVDSLDTIFILEDTNLVKE